MDDNDNEGSGDAVPDPAERDILMPPCGRCRDQDRCIDQGYCQHPERN